MEGSDACSETSSYTSWLDVHGAGAQRSDSKTILDTNSLSQGYTKVQTSSGDYAISHGPQGDVVRSSNYVRCVRDGE